MKSRVPRILLIFFAVAAAAAVAFTLINRSNKASQALPVSTYTVARGSLVEQITGTGSFKPADEATIAARVSGQVTAIPVEAGDRVTKGAVVLQIDPSDYRLAVEQAKSSLDSTRRNVRQSIVTLRAAYRSALTARDQAQRAYEKNKELYAGKAISGDTLKASEDSFTTAAVNLQSAREQLNLRLGNALGSEPSLDTSADAAVVEASPEVAQAKVSLESAQENLDKCTVRAPLSGTVTAVTPTVGDLVTQNSPLIKIEDLSAMRAEVQIDEVDIGKLSVGNSAEITSDSLIGTTLSGRVVSIAPTITSAGSTRVSTVKVSITGSELPLRSGASCSVKITTQTKKDVLNIPLTAFVSRAGEERSFVLVPLDEAAGAKQDSTKPRVYRLKEKTIKTGISTINSIEVTSGLAGGEIIANGTLNQLRAGMLVTPKEKL